MLLLLIIIAVAGSVLYSLLIPPVPESAAADIQKQSDTVSAIGSEEPTYTNIHL
ncbi:hypothetical protein PAECIP111893_02191 [Paenibacillus plantiphilus]|uniref:Uncharacterized protein n=1 Tax=Paenibacillus plantiphilus TaxID=2905650 RepID=A0ABN8GIG5_9BACL|nr:hypothetical protein [Paenibacillus plantiphilus]CAH1204219.1 hypothetical protein PAECIP111893_02191 [Paenibacillus plantiphilus]